MPLVALTRLLPVLLVLSLLAAGCARQSEVVKLYDNPGAARSGFEKLFVVAVTGDADQRAMLEQQTLARLRERGLEGVASHSVLGQSDTLLQEQIDRAVAVTASDGLLVSHIAQVETEVEHEPGREEIISECRGGDPVDFFLYDHRVIRLPDSVRLAHTVVVVTSLYDTATGDRLWTIQSTCFRKASLDEALYEESEAIVRQLGIDGLIGGSGNSRRLSR